MNFRKFKTYSLFVTLFLSSMILLCWSQNWFFLEVTFPTENSDELAISGQIAAPSLSALGLAGFAITAALSLSSILMTRILGSLCVVLGMFIVLVSFAAWSDPVFAASAQLTALSAISDIHTLRTLVIATTATAWPGIAAVSGSLFIPLGIVIMFTAGKWGTGSRKFDRNVKNNRISTKNAGEKADAQNNEDTSSLNIDAWDSLSHGIDPTIN